MQWGMHDVNTKWNGLSMAYQVNQEDHVYGYERPNVKKYTAEVLQFGLPEGQGVLGLVSESLPPIKPSTEITEPNLPNPYLDQRDASNDLDTDYHADPTAGMFPKSNWWNTHDRVHQDEFPSTESVSAWTLNQGDMQSMFIDCFGPGDDQYVDRLRTATAATQCEVACDGIEPVRIESILQFTDENGTVVDEDTYMSYLFNATRESEQWTPQELEEVQYSSLFCPQSMDEFIGERPTFVPGDLTMTIDHTGKSTPMACGVMIAKCVQGKTCSRLFRVLFDSGGSKSMIHRRVLPQGARIDQGEVKMFNTLAGAYASKGSVRLEGMRLPAFDKNRVIADHSFEVFDADCNYDIILGGDFLTKIGMNLQYKDLTIEWYGNVVPMETLSRPDAVASHVEQYLLQMEADDVEFDLDSYVAAPMLDAKYEPVSIDEVIYQHCSHLSSEQQRQLHEVLSQHTKLFDGTLGLYPGEPMHIDLVEGAVPVYRRPYPVPHVHLTTFKKELDHLVSIGVLSPVRDTEWGLPTFITPKKDGRVRWVSDLRELNKVVRRTQYTLPIITDVLRKRRGYEFLSKLDISMQYYTFELDDESKKLCTIVTPFGPYCYNRVPMGLSISPGFAQARMEEIFRDLADTECYIDDIGVFSTSWEDHLQTLHKVLHRLEENGFTVNPLKCEWGVKETDWLGYWLTPTGLKPWAKKVDAILKMKPPTTATELRTFLGMVTYYRDMWPRRSHVLAPFTRLAGLPKQAKIEWTKELDDAFNQMKALIADEALMAYPDHNVPFDIYTDASDYQLGACIMQKNRPVAYYSRKLTGAQKNYTTMEKELLAIVMVLREFRSMLLGADINIYTDHRNLTFANFNTQRVLRWRCFLEEYSPKLFYLEGKLNVLADAFSRLPRTDGSVGVEGKKPASSMESIPIDIFHLDEPDLYDCLKHHPDLESYLASYDHMMNIPRSTHNPLNYDWLKDTQDADSELVKRLDQQVKGYHKREFDEVELICYSPTGGSKNDNWQICLTDEAVGPAIAWFHQVLGHPGNSRLLKGMHRYYHPNLRQLIDRFKCDACQRHKIDGRGFGHLAPRDVRAAPWEQVDIDLIGPWSITTKTNRTYEFLALTCIDRVTGLTEMIRIENKEPSHVADKFSECWLARYPRPLSCCHDNGGEFTGWAFQKLLIDFGIKDKPTTSRNPTGNSICERMHREVGNLIRTKIHTTPPRTLAEAQDLVDSELAAASHALRVNVSHVTGYSPGALAFHRDMFLDIPLIVDLLALRDRRRVVVDENLRRVNAKRSSYDYKVDDQVLKKRHEWTKLGERWDGPYTICRVHVNGNVTVELRPGVTERLNIRRVKPYHSPTVPPPDNPVLPTEPISSRLRSRA